MDKKSLLKTIKAERVSQNLTQAQMAEQLGIRQAQYSRIESGTSEMNIEQLENICSILGIELMTFSKNITEEEIRENIDLIEKALSNLKSFFKL